MSLTILQFPIPAIKPIILEKLLKIGTVQIPFYDPLRKLYTQIDGVYMGSPLGPMFAEFYIENTIFNNHITKITIYIRYVDDIFITTQNNDTIYLNKTLRKIQF